MATSVCKGVEVLLLIQAALYLSLCLIQLVITIPLGDVYNDFNQRCVLFADFQWGLNDQSSNSTNATTTTDFHPWIISFDPSYGMCKFLISVNGIALIYTFIVSIYHVYMFYKSHFDIEIVKELYVKPFMVFDTIFAVLSLIMSGLVSAGFRSLCDEGESHNLKCGDLENDKYWKMDLQVRANASITDLKIAQATLWLGLMVWILQLASTILRHMKNTRLRSSERYAEYLQEHAIDMQTMSHTTDEKEETVLFDNSRTPLSKSGPI